MSIDDRNLLAWLLANPFPAKRVTYRITEATDDFVVFGATESTGKVMLPFGLIKEWIRACDQQTIRPGQSPREMREVVRERSEWAGQLHSFETHLAAIVQRWSMAGFGES